MSAWFVGSATASVVSAALSSAYWQLSYVPEANVHWSPADDMASMLLMIPVGWFMSLFTPWGWMNLAGLAWGLWTRSLKPLVLSLAGAALFGLLWPMAFTAMMGI